MSFSIACESRNQKERERCSVSFELMKQTGADNVNDNKLIVKFVSNRDGRCTVLKEFKSVTRVRFVKNGDDRSLYCMELFENSHGVKVRIEDEFLHCHRIVNTQKRFRFYETDIILKSKNLKNLKWEWEEEEENDSFTASNANPYIIES